MTVILQEAFHYRRAYTPAAHGPVMPTGPYRSMSGGVTGVIQDVPGANIVARNVRFSYFLFNSSSFDYRPHPSALISTSHRPAASLPSEAFRTIAVFCFACGIEIDYWHIAYLPKAQNFPHGHTKETPTGQIDLHETILIKGGEERVWGQEDKSRTLREE